MQRWTFPSSRRSIGSGTIKTDPGITHSHPDTPSEPPASATGTHIYRLSPTQAKQTTTERTLHSRITKQKATNDRLRKNIANLEAKSAYLRCLKELEKEAEKLEREGKELVRREEEVRGLIEREAGELEVEGDGVIGVEVRVWNGGREGLVKHEEEGSEVKRDAMGLRVKQEIESDDDDKDRVEMKHDFEENAQIAQEKWVEEIELLNGSAAWNWSDSRLAVEI